jgi:uncharacterized delta-60 repeat protein
MLHFHYKNILLTGIMALLPFLGIAQQAGDLDRSFHYGRGADYQFNYGYGANFGTVNSTVLQADGKILIVGQFTSYNGTTINRIARLNTDGSLDINFNSGTGVFGGVNSIAIQEDGKILIGGIFSSYNGTATNRIARLNTDGSLDANFSTGTGANGGVNSIAIQPNGKILIGGGFTSYNGTAVSGFARLNSDGSLDTNFYPGTGVGVGINSIALQADGKIIIGGLFASYNGNNLSCITRLNSDGSLDANFNATGTGASGGLNSIAVQADGKILIGGNITSYNGLARNRIARLNSDGNLDATFNLDGTGVNNIVHSMALQADGKILIGGTFTRYNGIVQNRVARLNSDGSSNEKSISVIISESVLLNTPNSLVPAKM